MSKIIKITAIILVIAVIVGIIVYLYGFSSGVQEERKQIRKVVSRSKVVFDMGLIRMVISHILANESNCIEINCNHLELKNLCQDIKEELGVFPIIHNRKTKNIIDCDWCAYIKMPSPYDGTYYCIDSKGTESKTDIDPSGKGYCTETSFECPPGY